MSTPSQAIPAVAVEEGRALLQGLETDLDQIGTWCHYWRDQQGRPVRVIAEALGRSTSTVQHWVERGRALTGWNVSQRGTRSEAAQPGNQAAHEGNTNASKPARDHEEHDPELPDNVVPFPMSEPEIAGRRKSSPRSRRELDVVENAKRWLDESKSFLGDARREPFFDDFNGESRADLLHRLSQAAANLHAAHTALSKRWEKGNVSNG